MEIMTNKQLRESSTQLYENFNYKLVDTPKSVKLVEVFIGKETVIGQVRSWKVYVLKNIADYYSDKDEREKGYRLFLTIKALNGLRNGAKVPRFVEVMKRLTLEETIFWVWQYHGHGRRAINAFNCIHMRKR